MQRLPFTNFKNCVVRGIGELLLLRLVMSSYFRFISTFDTGFFMLKSLK